MALPVNVDTLIHGNIVESTRIEFKEDFNPERVVHTICAFANDIDNIGGGYIIIGVKEENGSPQFPLKGLEKSSVDGIMKSLNEYCNLIEPRYIPVCEPVFYEGKHLIVLWCKGGTGRPYTAPKLIYSAKDKGSKAGGRKESPRYYYIRKLSSTIRASEEEIKDLFYISENIPFDDRPNVFASVDDLDRQLMIEHLQAVNSALFPLSSQKTTHDLAKDMDLISGPPEQEYPINAAILFFAQNPQKYFREAYIEIVQIPDAAGKGIIEKKFTGPIQYQLKAALNYIQNNIIEEKVFKDPQRPEADRIYNYPMAAIDEILANAVYHKSYQVREPITVRITKTSIEVTSHPGFHTSIKDKDIQQFNICARFYRNRRMGDLLKELHLIGGRNTGFPTILKALQENGSSSPAFSYDEDRRYLSVTLAVHPSFDMRTNKEKRLILYQNRILEILSEQPLTITQLAREMGYKGITNKLKSNIEILVNKNRIERAVGQSGEILLRGKQ